MNHDLDCVYHSYYVCWYIDKWWLDCPSHFLSLRSPSTDKRPGFQIQTGPQRTKECAYAVLAVFMYSVLFLHLDCSWICFHCLPPAITQNGVNATALAIQRGHTEVVRDLLDKFGASLRLTRKGLLVCRNLYILHTTVYSDSCYTNSMLHIVYICIMYLRTYIAFNAYIADCNTCGRFLC